MIRKVIIPIQETISINLPKSYIGKQVEIIAFTLEEENSILMDAQLLYEGSETSLAKDWSSPEEDSAWKDL